MFAIVLEYVVDLAKVDAALSAHNSWLDEQYSSGLFIASGRREPRVGGVILARGDLATIKEAVSKDPFGIQGLATHTIIEFHPSRFGEPLNTETVRSALR